VRGRARRGLQHVTREEQACADVCSAVFSALTRSRSPQAGGIPEVLATALGTLDTDTATLLAELTEAGLAGTGGLPIWRHLMTTSTYPYVSELRAQGRAEGRTEGRAQGKAESIAGILDRRHIALTSSERQDILSCTDPETLGTWFDLSFTATTAAELFAAAGCADRRGCIAGKPGKAGAQAGRRHAAGAAVA
jgi:hypothetical protein